jgi:hypothetical protein
VSKANTILVLMAMAMAGAGLFFGVPASVGWFDCFIIIGGAFYILGWGTFSWKNR